MKGKLFSSLSGKASREARKLSPPQAEIFGISTWKHGIFCDFDLQRHTNSLRKLYFCKHRSKKFPPAAGLVHEQLFPVPASLVILSLPHPERFRELDEMYCAKRSLLLVDRPWIHPRPFPLRNQNVYMFTCLPLKTRSSSAPQNLAVTVTSVTVAHALSAHLVAH